MKIAVQIEGGQGLTWPAWEVLVREVDALGFTGLYCCDLCWPRSLSLGRYAAFA